MHVLCQEIQAYPQISGLHHFVVKCSFSFLRIQSMHGGGGMEMALRMTRLAGLLMFSNVQASDIADGSTKVPRKPCIFIYFYRFWQYFFDFWSNIKVLGQNKVGIVQTPPRSAEINRYFVKRSHLDPKRLTFDKNPTPLKIIISRLCFLASRRSQMSRRLR